MSRLSSPPLVLLAAHGERGGDGRNQGLAELQVELQSIRRAVEVQTVIVSDKDALDAVFAANAARRGVVVPILFSDGFFYSARLSEAVAAMDAAPDAGFQLLPPFGMWPELAVLVADELTSRAFNRGVDVLVIAHGSTRSTYSADAARAFAIALEAEIGGAVRCAFLEESPKPVDMYREHGAPDVAIGLFFGAGLHGRDDFAEAIAASPNPPATAFTIGEMGGLAEMIAARVDVWLTDVPV
ncbi:MAG: hypothetical protein AAGB25_03075 [Pseudomonadota bacterium]